MIVKAACRRTYQTKIKVRDKFTHNILFMTFNYSGNNWNEGTLSYYSKFLGIGSLLT